MSRIEAVIFDWAGTTVDHGCLAPLGVFVAVFAQAGVAVTHAEARRHMGTHKREHIRRMLADIPERWESFRGAPHTDADIDALYAATEPMLIGCVSDYATPTPGALEAVAWLRGRGAKIGSTTGYNRGVLDALLPAAAARGYRPDVAFAASDVPAGRPAPYLCWRAALELGVSAARLCVNVGDTVVDVQSGLNAGMWAVSVARTGNEIGLSEGDWAALAPGDQRAALAGARERLAAAGAHYAIDDLTGLPAVIEDIERRLAAGERP